MELLVWLLFCWFALAFCSLLLVGVEVEVALWSACGVAAGAAVVSVLCVEVVLDVEV